ncbi:Lyzozyme M1 (1,4-beta-N-acetylmuramidase), GH25 family [Lachnospiraceae bacterium NE2001]|nr:Lyzozyme M1 (1,4-beta-N-acetylmuramidase), GH25 family [Lachnospiraceae bacterium NE2001]
MGEKIKSFLIGLIVLVAFVGVALLVTTIAMSDHGSSKKEETTVEIGNSDKITSMPNTTEATTVQSNADEEADISQNTEEEVSLAEPAASSSDAEGVDDEVDEAAIANAENNNNSSGSSGKPANNIVSYGDYFSDNHEDTKAPFFLIKSSSASLGLGEAFDIHNYVGYADDTDRDVELVVEGDLDTSTAGTYNLSITLKDDAGHTKSDHMTVYVDETPADSSSPSGSSAPGTVDFATFAENYGGENKSLGIDVSRWQGDIDFNAVKAAGCEYVIIRLGGYDDGENYTDRTYYTNIKNAKAAGLKVGIYWHAEESNADEVKKSASYLLNILNGESLDFPIAYDWEDFGNFESYGMNLYDINDCFYLFADEMKSAGYDTCLYSSKNFLENVWTNEKGYKVWLANYTTKTSYAGSYYMWQQTSSGIIDGINGAVDFNIWYK